ncbi:MAG: hypothetical protein AAF986_11020, partial [Pseudomonadota bacterium]
ARLRLFGHDGPMSSQKSAIRLLEKCRKQYGTQHCEILPGKLEVCRACTTAPGETDKCLSGAAAGRPMPQVVGYGLRGARYRALPGEYFEFDGLPFAGKCTLLSVLPHIPRTCEFDYQMEDGLSVMCRIYDDAVPETEFIAYDRHIRALISSARAPAYDK